MADYALAISETEILRYQFMAAAARDQEIDDWAAAGIVTGAVVGDVGCGPAATSAVLGEVVGREGRVIAVERDPAALEQARMLLAHAGATNVELRQGEATSTGIAPGSLDAVMMRHVLAHNGGREQDIVDHLAGLVRPGGSVYLVDVDLTMARYLDLDPGLVDLQPRYAEFHRGLGNDPQVGLRLGRLLEGAGLVDVRHRALTTIMPVPAGMRPPAFAARSAMLAAGVATEADVRAWEEAALRNDALDPRPTMFLTSFAGSGRVGGAPH